MKWLLLLIVVFGLSACYEDQLDPMPKPAPPEKPATNIKSLVGTKWISNYISEDGKYWCKDVLEFGDKQCTHTEKDMNGITTTTFDYTYELPFIRVDWKRQGKINGSTMTFQIMEYAGMIDRELKLTQVDQ